MNNGIWIIGDVHGCYKTLKALIEKLPKDAKICFVGDLIDRGADSQKVIKLIREQGYDCVLGNHEAAMILNGREIMEDSKLIQSKLWTSKRYNYGGMDTLRSYKKCLEPGKVFMDDLEWLETLPLYLEYPNIKDEDGRYLVVTHSCVDDSWELKDTGDPTDENIFYNKVLYYRKKNPADNKEIFNVFGHTPKDCPVVKNHYANIDTGAYLDREGYGKLTAFHFPSKRFIQQENIEDTAEKFCRISIVKRYYTVNEQLVNEENYKRAKRLFKKLIKKYDVI